MSKSLKNVKKRSKNKTFFGKKGPKEWPTDD